MTFTTAFALFVCALVGLPYLAHRLRRHRTRDIPFAAAHLVQAAKPEAKRRQSIDDRPLLIIRSLLIAALALLGAAPFVRCARISVARTGASIALAIVIDDSMSMRQRSDGKSRFERALFAARDLVSQSRDGDSIAIVLAGSPPRVVLAPTTNLGAASDTLASLRESDRATDLDSAIDLARSLVASAPQVDRTVVLLSDLADGKSDAAPLAETAGVAVWYALDLARDLPDCAILTAEKRGQNARIKFACSKGASADGRDIVIRAGDKVVGRARANGASDEISIAIAPSSSARTESGDAQSSARSTEKWSARLEGSDAIASDDEAPLVSEVSNASIGIVREGSSEFVATGGAPVIEQAFSALRLEINVRPLPVLPESSEEIRGYAGLVLDDPPGLSPEQRRAVRDFLESGKSIFLAVGPRSAGPPLGATLEPLLAQGVRFGSTTSKGVSAESARLTLDGTLGSFVDLKPRGRCELSSEDARAATPLLAWDDGAPLLVEKKIGKGSAWIMTLPMSTETSDLPLRPGFLAILAAWTEIARATLLPSRVEVGAASPIAGGGQIECVGPDGPCDLSKETTVTTLTHSRIGRYLLTLGDKENRRQEERVATPLLREIDLRPRRIAEKARDRALGSDRPNVDASPYVAALVLLLFTIELAMRAWLSMRRKNAS